VPKYNWSRANVSGMRDELRRKRWRMEEETDVDEDWQEFKETLLLATEKYVPVFKPRTNIRPKWLSRDIMKLIRQKKGGVERSEIS
jgi:hypothetical protein